MTHTFMYPQVTQIARRAHGVPASWRLSNAHVFDRIDLTSG